VVIAEMGRGLVCFGRSLFVEEIRSIAMQKADVSVPRDASI